MAPAKKEKCGCHAAKVMLGEVGYWPVGSPENALEKTMQVLWEGLGDDFESGVEMMTRTYNPVQAIRCRKAIEPFRPMFAEEIIRHEAATILQPAILIVDGMTAMRKIAHLAKPTTGLSCPTAA